MIEKQFLSLYAGWYAGRFRITNIKIVLHFMESFMHTVGQHAGSCLQRKSYLSRIKVLYLEYQIIVAR